MLRRCGGTAIRQLKYSSIKDTISAASKELGHVLSFAQTDVIERLLAGADPIFVQESANFVRVASRKIATAVSDLDQRRKSRADVKRRSALIDTFTALAFDEYRDFASETQCAIKHEFERMIAMMPKLEIIELAEALVSITAIERKATSDEGTVGGPVDVAFLTKHEGFVWIKRKHYFEPALNPRYFWRKYNLGQRSP